MAYFALILLFLGGSLKAYSQDLPLPVQSFLETYTTEQGWEQQEEVEALLYHALQFPYNINQISRKELEQFPFLSATQIENLLEYRYDNQYFLHQYELALIEDWDEATIALFLPFVQFIPPEDPPTFQHFFQNIQQEAIQLVGMNFPFQEGYKNQHFLGPPVQFGGKYKLSHPLLEIGLSVENDAGEPFGWQYNKGFDFYSGYVRVQDPKGNYQLIVGDYKPFFGQGLILSSAAYTPSFDIAYLHQRRDKIHPSYSFNEVNYQRGMGFSMQWKKWAFTVLGSINYQDKAAGIHRTLQQWSQKKQGIVWGVGGNINYQWDFLKLGFSTYHNSPTQLTFFSLDYRGVWKFLTYSGEIAVNTKGKIATLHQFTAQVHPACLLGGEIHYYSPQFSHSYGTETVPTTFVLGEYGGALGVQAQVGKWKIQPSFLLTRNGKKKSTSHQPAIQYKAGCKFLYQPKENQLLQIRYQWTSKELNVAIEKPGISPTYFYHKHLIQLHYNGLFSNGLYLKMGGMAQMYTLTTKKLQASYLLHLDAGYKNPSYKAIARIALFDIPYFANRISIYENNLPYSSSFQAYYDTGIRAYLYGSFQICSFLKIYLKIAHTYYIHKKNIGTGDATIHGPHVTDVQLLLQWNW